LHLKGKLKMEHVTLSVSELSGAALDWAVAKAWQSVYSDKHLMEHAKGFTPSTDWAQGGPIIERERITVWGDNPFWEAERGSVWCNGPTPLIAAMRCYVASKLGDKIDVPLPLVG
jgi:hypothetical protein